MKALPSTPLPVKYQLQLVMSDGLVRLVNWAAEPWHDGLTVNNGDGSGLIVMTLTAVLLQVRPGCGMDVAVSATDFVPVDVYTCFGFCREEPAFPSSKYHMYPNVPEGIAVRSMNDVVSPKQYLLLANAGNGFE